MTKYTRNLDGSLTAKGYDDHNNDFTIIYSAWFVRLCQYIYVLMFLIGLVSFFCIHPAVGLGIYVICLFGYHEFPEYCFLPLGEEAEYLMDIYRNIMDKLELDEK